MSIPAMAPSSDLFPSFLKFNEAVDLFYEILLDKLSDTLASNTSVTLGKICNGAVLRLHNSNSRPTVYEFSISCDRYSRANRVVLDTIINEQQPDHDMLKTSFPFSSANHIISIALRLSQQKCDGDENLTLTRYQQIGLLYASKANNASKQGANLL